MFWPPIHLKYISSNVTVFQSNSNGQFFTYGTHVIQYIAIDNIGHSNQCRFAVTVKQRQSRHLCYVQAIEIIIIHLFLNTIITSMHHLSSISM